MPTFFEGSFWESVLNVFKPDVILLLTQILIPFSIIAIIVIICLTYFFTKRFIIKKQFKIKNYLFVVLISLLIYYILVGSIMVFIEIGLAGISQYI